MLTQSQAADIFERIRKHSTADEVEVLFYGTSNALTRFANNTIHQNVAEEEDVVVSVRASFDGRTRARHHLNKLDDENLKRVVQAAESMAEVQHPDADLLAMPGRSDAGTREAVPPRHFPQTAALTPKERAGAVKKMVSVARNTS